MLLIVILHIAAVLLSSWLHHENLIGEMVTGRKPGRPDGALASAWRSLAVLMLAARLRVLVRSAHGQPRECLEAQAVMLDPAARSVRQAGAAVAQSTREFDLLHILMVNAGRVLSREQLEQHLYS